jgi:hypothetical protein
VVVGYLLDGFLLAFGCDGFHLGCVVLAVPLPLSCATVTSGPFSGKNPSLWPYDVTGKI